MTDNKLMKLIIFLILMAYSLTVFATDCELAEIDYDSCLLENPEAKLESGFIECSIKTKSYALANCMRLRGFGQLVHYNTQKLSNHDSKTLDNNVFVIRSPRKIPTPTR